MRPGRTALRDLVRTTPRRGVHLLLGGVVLIPYVLLAVGFAQMLADPGVPWAPVVVLIAVTVVIGTVPPFLPAIRTLEITASRGLLDVDLPDPVADPPWETRLLGAAWYVLHLLCGGVAIFAILFAVPMSVLLAAQGFGVEQGWAATSMPVFSRLEGPWALAAAPGMLVVAVAVVVGLGVLLAKLAPLLLGPSPVELTMALEAQAEEFAERNRLARELHDSVGHALTVTTLQAAAARRVLDTDPEFARRALTAVEQAGRAAMEDLDHVLGVLRARADGASGAEGSDRLGGGPAPGDRSPGDGPTPLRTLPDVVRLVDDTRAAGVQVDATLDGDLTSVPPALSREAYRIVQEGLTNVIRHAGHVPVVLHVAVTSSGLDIDLSNPLPDGGARPRDGGGRGLRGMRERVRLFRGELTAGAESGLWRVHVHLPTRSAAGGDSR